MSGIEQQIREAARKYLESGSYCVIGYERSAKGKVRPVFVYQAADVDRLIWGPECNLNLVNYVHRFKQPLRRGEAPPKIAVVARPCDARAVNLLVHEQQIKRENIKIIGVACSGEQERAACQACRERVPVTSDTLVQDAAPDTTLAPTDTYSDLAELEGWTPQQRLDYWLKEFDRCIRCYACRQACPGCYCYECVAEQVDPHWTSIAMEVPEKYFFHLMRAFHLAGRCVSCNACEVVCPMGIPLSQLNRKLAKEVEALFGYRTGDDPVKAPPLATFDPGEHLRL